MKTLSVVLLLTLALLTPLLANRARSQSASPSRNGRVVIVPVHLNGRPFASGIALRTSRGERRLLIDLHDLMAAVDGTDPEPRLDVRGRALYAIGHNGCPACAVRVNRTVLISAAIERIDDRLYVPIDDVVRAFEGRLETVRGGAAYGIHVGVCSWCILEPVDRP